MRDLILARVLWVLLWAVCAVVAVAAEEDCGCDAEAPEVGFFGTGLEEELERRAEDGVLQLELFVMSLCPYGMQAQQHLVPLVERFGDKVDWRLYFIADELSDDKVGAGINGDSDTDSDTRDQVVAATTTPPAQGATPQRAGCAAAEVAGDGPFASLHGQPEIDESRRQLVVAADWPAVFTEYLLCRSRQGPAGEWTECARSAGLDPDSVQVAALGARGEALFRQNIRRANDLDIDLSPTLLVDGEEFAGPYEFSAIGRALCRRGVEAEVCDEIPVCGGDGDCERGDGQVALCLDPDGAQARCQYRSPAPFILTVLETAVCPSCEAESFLRTTTGLFPGARVVRLEAHSPEAGRLASRHGVEAYPAFLFDTAFGATARFGRVQHLLRPLDGGGFALRPQINRITYWSSRLAAPGRLDLFIAAGASNLEAKLLELWPEGADLRLHYWGPGQPGGDERRRRACLAENFPGRAAAYARARLAGATWAAAANRAGLDTAAVAACASEVGPELVRRTEAAVQSFGLQAGDVVALSGNRVLTRRVGPADLAQLRQTGVPELTSDAEATKKEKVP
jgi:hypothetical protein